MSRLQTKSSLLKDNSWIRKLDDEDEDIDRDPNYAKSILSHTITLESSEPEETKPVRTSTTSVSAITQRFSGGQDEPKSRSPVVTSPTQTFTERVRASSKSSPYSSYSPTKTTKVTETITSNNSAEDKLYDSLIPSSIKDSSSKTTYSSSETVTVRSSTDGDGYKTTTTTRTSSSAEDDLFDTLLSKSPASSIRKREIVTVESSRGESPTLSSPSYTRRSTSYSSYTDDIPASRTTSYTISTKPSEDYSSETTTYSYTKPDSSYSLYTDDIPASRTTSYTISTKPSENYSSETTTYSYTKPDSSYEYSNLSSPSTYTSTYRSSRSDDILADPIYSKSSKSVYSSSDRTVNEKDLCTHCRKPFTGDAKMILDDLNINCHASCFKCQVCHNNLGLMKAGDSLWVYKQMVYCENCFEKTSGVKWHR